MKKTTIYVLILGIITSTISCKKDFLQVKQNAKVVQITAADCQAILDNYDIMNSEYPSHGELSSDDYFVLSANAIGNGENQQFYRWEPNAQVLAGADYSWAIPYLIVYNANVVIQAVEKEPGALDQTTLNGLKGSALFFRANMFYQLAQLYTKQYDPNTANQDLGIPVRTDPSISVESSRGSVQQTYDQIIKDFKEAIELLPNTSSKASRPNKAAAYAALAKTYLTMGNYTDAGSYANECLKIYSSLMDYNTLNQVSSTPFVRFNSEVIFQSYMQAKSITQPNTQAFVDLDLYNSYASDDLRKSLFFKPKTGGYRFSGSYNQTTVSNFFNGIAVDEVYLIRAECNARNGKIIEAMNDLNTLLVTRWKSGTYVNMTASNAEDALIKVLTERRKELIFRGRRWTDLKRLNKDIRFQKTLIRNVDGATYTLPPNDLRYSLLLPLVALNYSSLQQNPR